MNNITQNQALMVIEATRTIYENTKGTHMGGAQVILGMDDASNTCWLVYDVVDGDDRWRVLSHDTDTVLFESDDPYEVSVYIITRV